MSWKKMVGLCACAAIGAVVSAVCAEEYGKKRGQRMRPGKNSDGVEICH